MTWTPPPHGHDWQTERVAAYGLDAWAAGRPDLWRPHWQAHSSALLAELKPLEPRDGGSWNIPVLCMAAAYLTGTPLDRDLARGELREYLTRQLDPSSAFYHHFMGREQLSSLYCWPAFALGLVLVEAAAKTDTTLTELTRRWLRTYTLLISLGAYPVPGHGLATSVLVPGGRTPTSWAPNGMLASFWERAVGRRTRIPADWWEHHDSWPGRVASVIRYDWLAPEEQARLRQLRNSGTPAQAQWVFAELQRLAVKVRVPMHFQRHTDGLAAVMDGNAHNSTPPLAGLVWRERQLHLASPWPPDFRGEGERRLGTVQAAITPREIMVQTTGASWGHHQPIGERVGDTVTVRAALPAGPVIWRGSVDSEGARWLA